MSETLEFYDRVVCRIWPEMKRGTSMERINTCALVRDVIEGKTRFTISDDLREKILMAAKGEKSAEAER